jgi:hypothetical protein
MFSNKIYALYKLSHDVTEVDAENKPFAFIRTTEQGEAVLLFSGGCIHGVFPCHHNALDEIHRIRGLLREAEDRYIQHARYAGLRCEKWIL